MPRIDRVAVRWSLQDRWIRLAVLTGIPSTSPAPPALTRTSDIYELGLADVVIPASAGSVTNITDTRMDVMLCGTAKTRTYLTFGEADTEQLLVNIAGLTNRISALEAASGSLPSSIVTFKQNVTVSYFFGSQAGPGDPYRWEFATTAVSHSAIKSTSTVVCSGRCAFGVTGVSNGSCTVGAYIYGRVSTITESGLVQFAVFN
jgi:hypothetical protein